MFNDNDRGQVGIGTLIVFIAMVLVAAIAAGVLINTAGLLQSQAEATGEESADQVSDRVQVSTVTGVAGDEDEEEINDALEEGKVDRIKLSVFRSPGAGDIALTDSIVEVFANGESGTLTFDEDSTDEDDFTFEDDYQTEPGAAEDGDLIQGFAVLNVQGADDGTLSDSSDRAQIVFDLTHAAEPLEEGDTVSITVTTAAGGTAFVEKRAPSTIDNGETYRL